MDWTVLAISAASISFIIVSLFYMFALAFNLPGLKSWCKSEYMQVIASFLLIGLIALFVQVASSAASTFTYSAVKASTTSTTLVNPATGQPFTDIQGRPIDLSNTLNPLSTDHFAIAQLYLARVIECEKRIYIDCFWANAFIEQAEKFSIGIAGVEPVAGWPLSGAVSQLHFFTNTLTYALFAQYLQAHLLEFAQMSMLTLFLPAGIILRSFPMFRGAGGFLIATAFGFYFVFPLSLVMIASVQGNVDSMCSISPPGEFASFQETCNSSPTDITIHISRAKNFFDGGGDSWLSRVRSFVLLSMMQAMFFPIVAFVITITFIRATSALFGADLAEIGRGIIKLI